MEPNALVFQSAEGEGPGIPADCLRHRNRDWKIISLYLKEAIPEDWREFSLRVVMGGDEFL